MTIRTEWRWTNEQIAADVAKATGKRVWRVQRTSGLYAYVTFSDGKQMTVRDGQRL